MKKFKELKENEIKDAVDNYSSRNKVLQILDCHTNSYNYKSLEDWLDLNGYNKEDYKRRITKEEYLLNPKSCKFCGTTISWDKRENIFCNSSCSASFNNTANTSEKVQKLCINCNNALGKNATKYCCRNCQTEYEYKEFIFKWKEGIESGKSGDGTSEHIRKYLFKKYNNKCMRCGWGEINIFTNKVPLTIHHIDGIATNNKEENLELLCPNCHSLTDNYGSRNIASTRTYRQKYRNLE